MATNKHSEYVIFIAFPLQHYLKERALMLRYTCIVCLVLKSTQLYKSVSFDILGVALKILEEACRKLVAGGG
jgi:hypothetical protein